MENQDLTGDDIENALETARIANVLPIIERRVDMALSLVVNKAASAIKRGDLTPELAQTLWFEYVATRNLLRNFQTAVSLNGSTQEN